MAFLELPLSLQSAFASHPRQHGDGPSISAHCDASLGTMFEPRDRSSIVKHSLVLEDCLVFVMEGSEKSVSNDNEQQPF